MLRTNKLQFLLIKHIFYTLEPLFATDDVGIKLG